jgi:mRNA interferase YafQ
LAKPKLKPKLEAETPEPPPSPLILGTTTQFDRDAKRQEKRGKSLDKLHAIVHSLRTHQPLAWKQRDHALTGRWKGYRDCHIEPDWVLIYLRESGQLTLVRTGTHSDLELD